MPHWDDHTNLKEAIGNKLPHLDQAVGGLMDDLKRARPARPRDGSRHGEFGRTPRLNQGFPALPIPGRDHWGNAISVMMAGGGIRGGQLVGRTNSKAEYPIERPLKPADILATVYQVLGIDPTLNYKDHSGRPIPILDEGRPIEELF